jgi:SAM-dependent methyltransferase
MQRLIDKIYHNRVFSRLFPTTVFCLRKNLKGCESVLDLGCGSSSPLEYCKNVKRSAGVEVFGPAIEKSKKRKIHTEYVEKKVEEVDFPEKSFDAVILIELLEHLPQNAGCEMLSKAEKWARKRVIVSTPNGFFPQNEYGGNPFQKHLSGWSLDEMKKRGYRCWGLSGLKFIRLTKAQPSSKLSSNNFMASIRLRPKIFWFAMATLSQAYTYFFPARAFEIFCVKEIK